MCWNHGSVWLTTFQKVFLSINVKNILADCLKKDAFSKFLYQIVLICNLWSEMYSPSVFNYKFECKSLI